MGIAGASANRSVRCAKHTTGKLRNVARMWPPSKAATIAGRCLDAARDGMVRAPTSGQMRASKERNAGARVKYSKTRQKSSLATIRNNQRPYHRTGENRVQRYSLKYLYLARESILYCNYRQSRIDSLLLTITKCNQFFILNNDKVQLIVNCYLRQSGINSLFFIPSKCN